MAKKKGPMRSVQRGVNKANTSIKSIAAVLDQQSDLLQQLTTGSAAVDDDKRSGGGSQQLIALKIFQAQLDLQKDAADNLKRLVAGQNKQVEALQKGNKDWKGFGEKFKDLKRNLKESIDPDNIKKALLGNFSMFKGARDKKEDIEFMQRMKALGDKRAGDPAAMKQAAKEAREAKEGVLRAQAAVDKLKKMGASDKQIQASPQMAARNTALAQYNAANTPQTGNVSAQDAANKMGGNTAGTTAPPPLPDIANKMGGNPSQVNPANDVAQQHENQLESIRILNSQTDLLQQIANNTAGKSDNSSAGGSEDSGGGGGILGSFGVGLKALGEGMKSIGTGVGKGIEAILRGLARGVMALANPVALVGLGAFTLAMMGVGKALEYAAPAIEAFAPVMMKVADVIQNVFITAIQAIPDIIGSIGDVIMGVIGAISDAIVSVIDAVTSSVERLAAVDGNNLLNVAAGLLAVSGALAAFGAGSALAGLGTLVSNFLTMGKDSPIDQLIKLASIGGDILSAADGISGISQAMKGFSGIDKKTMGAINDFPWDKATTFVAAGGAMSVAGAKVYNASKGNADSQATVDAQSAKGGTTANVNQVNQSSVQNTTVKPSVRNQESSQSRYLAARY